MPDSPIRKLAPFANGAKERGVHVIHLNIGQPDIATPTSAMDAIRNINREVLEYSPSEGFASYRRGLARYYQSVGVRVTSDEIMVTTGGSEALVFAFMSCLNPGDQVIIPEPFYANYNGFAINSGVKVRPIKSDIEGSFALPAISEFEKAVNEKTKAIMVCNPNNPTGYLYSEQELNTLREIALKHDLYLIADEVYREFCYDGQTHYSVFNLEGIDDNMIVIDSVSKRYSMCGARIGCIVSKNKELMATAMKFAQARLSPPTFAQIASEAALDTPQSYFDDVIEEYKDRRDTLIAELQKIEGVKVAKPNGAFYCIVELPVEDSDVFAQWLLEDFRLNNETIMVAPAAGFYSTEGLGKNQVRIAYVLNKEDLKTSVAILKAALTLYNA